jgi:DNA polymerase III psi subunit
MTVNQRQFDQLTEMGISLWQHKSATFDHDSSIKDSPKHENSFIEQTDKYLTNLATQTIFIDILQSLGLSIGEVSHKKDHLDLGLFNWYFSSKKQEEPSIHCTDNNLISPSVELISQSPALKKQLWQIIAKNLL